jgi:hypothetical protein
MEPAEPTTPSEIQPLDVRQRAARIGVSNAQAIQEQEAVVRSVQAMQDRRHVSLEAS